jgi:hypothetical protein
MSVLNATDITYETRVSEIGEAWAFIIDKLDGLDMHSIELVSQWWKPEGALDSEEWQDTIKVKVSGRMLEEKS